MFESAEVGHSIPEEEYARREPALRAALLAAQYRFGAMDGFPIRRK